MSFNKFLENPEDYFFNMSDIDKTGKFKPLMDNYRYSDISKAYFYFNQSSKLWIEQKSDDSVIYRICEYSVEILIPEQKKVLDILNEKMIKHSAKGKKATIEETDEMKEVEEAIKLFTKFITKTIKDHQTSKFAKSILSFFKHHIRDDNFKEKININNHHLLPLKTKNLNLKTLKMEERIKEQYFTKALDFIDLNDLTDDSAFKIVDKFFLDICTGHIPKKDYLQKIMGYFLSGAVNLGRTFYIFYGEGRNGKSALIEIISSVLQHYIKPVESSIIVKRGKKNAGQASPELEVLDYGLRVAILSETEDGEKLNETLIKNITGYDNISYRALRQDEKSFKSEAKLVLLTNHKPKFEFSKSMVDRLRFMAFNSRFISCSAEDEEKGCLKQNEYRSDPLLIQNLKTIYKSYVLLWCAIGAKRFFEEEHMDIPNDNVLKLENLSYINEMDSYARFKNECLHLDNEEKVLSSDVSKEYKTFCESECIPPIKPSELKRLLDNDFEKSKVSNNFYHGFTLKRIIESRLQFSIPDPSGLDM